MKILNRITKKILWKNKTRTIVTIIGIVLSAALFTAVLCSVTSLQEYMLRIVEEENGSWYGSFSNLDYEQYEEVIQNQQIRSAVTLQQIGYAEIESTNELKPYLYLAGVEEDVDTLLNIDITEGRMPVNQQEILLPNHLATNGNVFYHIGDTISLDVGKRLSLNGDELSQTTSLLYQTDKAESEEIQLRETLTQKQTMQFIVVGFYERPSIDVEGYYAPGYTALTLARADKENYHYDVYYQNRGIYKARSFNQKLYEELGDEEIINQVNSSYLSYSGFTSDEGASNTLWGMAAILGAIIMIGSVSLIYNAFSISVSERTKMFGILKSVGATKRQMKYSVLYEGLILSAIGIPIGIVVGICGIALTFRFTRNMFRMILAVGAANVTLYVRPYAIGMTIILCLITVLISAYIPAGKAAKKTAIAAIRQSDDIKLKSQRLRTWKITDRLFHFEGTLAAKNFKRNGKRGRATIISLALSIFLFIVASGFCTYLSYAVEKEFHIHDYDVSVSITSTQQDNLSIDEIGKLDDLKQEILDIPEVTEISYLVNLSLQDGCRLYANPEDLSLEYKEFCENNDLVIEQNEDGQWLVFVGIYCVDDDTFLQLLKDNHLSKENYYESDEPLALGYSALSLNGTSLQGIDENKTNVKLTCDFSNEGETESGDSQSFVDIGDFIEELPRGLYMQEDDLSFYVIYPVSRMAELPLETTDDTNILGISSQAEFYLKSTDAAATEDTIRNMNRTDYWYELYYIYNEAEGQEVVRSLVGIIKIFSYGFIILITLISIANVFHTISTNVNLRRREFAMLRSVGMTQKGFQKMMNYECLQYGVRGVLYSLPISFAFLYLMYKLFKDNLELDCFFVPGREICIAIISVFVVVFVTMMYSMSKIKNDNPVETLRNENL